MLQRVHPLVKMDVYLMIKYLMGTLGISNDLIPRCVSLLRNKEVLLYPYVSALERKKKKLMHHPENNQFILLLTNLVHL